ncbi:MAG: GNAT family N-acetyltransferase [Phycisphaerales bacterium]|nr:GNAT family N-acetyltransferase [Phycisphaerales bacterium]
MSITVIETKRMRVRRLVESDARSMFEVYSDPEGCRWVDDGNPITLDECVLWIDVTHKNYQNRGYGMFAAEDRACGQGGRSGQSGQVVGFCGIVHPNQQPEPEIKYAIRRERWGQGLATELASGMLRYAEQELGISRVIATIAPENTASQRVAARIGMQLIDPRIDKDGTRIDVYEWLGTAST